MLHRWNFSIILIITAFVVGAAAGYVYRDRYSWLLPNFANLERTEPDIAADIARTNIEDILRPDSGLEASSGESSIYSFTGTVLAVSASSLTVDQPTDATDTVDAIDFILTPETIYVTAVAGMDENGLPGLTETEIDGNTLQVGDIVSVYTLEDIRTSSELHVSKVQQLVD